MTAAGQQLQTGLKCAYDAENRLRTVKRADTDALLLDLRYDAEGRRSWWIEYPAQPALETSYDCDVLGRILTTTRTSDQLSRVSSTTYDIAGRITASTDEDGLVTGYEYGTTQGGGRWEKVTRPDGEEITEYYRDGRVYKVYGSGVIQTKYEYGIDSNDKVEWTKVYTGPDGPGGANLSSVT